MLGSIYNLIGDPGMPVQWVDTGPAELVVTIRHGDGGVGAEVEWTGGVAPYVVQRRAAAEGSVWGKVTTTYEHRWHLPADDGAFLVRVISDQR